jgi:hypothetical protein
MLKNLELIHNFVIVNVCLMDDSPIIPAFTMLKNCISSLPSEDIIKKKEIFEIIDRYTSNYKYDSPSYGEILEKYEKYVPFDLLDHIRKFMKGSVAKIAAYLKNDISEYFKEKGL